MTKFTVRLTRLTVRTLQQWLDIEVEAASVEEASAKALELDNKDLCLQSLWQDHPEYKDEDPGTAEVYVVFQPKRRRPRKVRQKLGFYDATPSIQPTGGGGHQGERGGGESS